LDVLEISIQEAVSAIAKRKARILPAMAGVSRAQVTPIGPGEPEVTTPQPMSIECRGMMIYGNQMAPII